MPFYIVSALFTRRPYPLPKNFSPEILGEIRRRMHVGDVHALHLNHLDAAQYIEWLDGASSQVKIVFDTHNLLTSLYAQLVRSERNVRRGYLGSNGEKCVLMNRRLCAKRTAWLSVPSRRGKCYATGKLGRVSLCPMAWTRNSLRRYRAFAPRGTTGTYGLHRRNGLFAKCRRNTMVSPVGLPKLDV